MGDSISECFGARLVSHRDQAPSAVALTPGIRCDFATVAARGPTGRERLFSQHYLSHPVAQARSVLFTEGGRPESESPLHELLRAQ
jgi:hypothetical protein